MNLKTGLFLVLIASLWLAGCSGQSPQAATQAPMATEAPAEPGASVPTLAAPTPGAGVNGYPGAAGGGAAAASGYPGPGETVGVAGGDPSLPPEAPAAPPAAAAGKAAVSGVLFAPETVGVIKGTMFFLRPAPGPDEPPPALMAGPDATLGDVIGTTDLNGEFVLNDVAPGSYTLLVWAPYDWRPAKAGQESEAELEIELKAGESRPLGIVYVDWP